MWQTVKKRRWLEVSSKYTVWGEFQPFAMKRNFNFSCSFRNLGLSWNPTQTVCKRKSSTAVQFIFGTKDSERTWLIKWIPWIRCQNVYSFDSTTFNHRMRYTTVWTTFVNQSLKRSLLHGHFVGSICQACRRGDHSCGCQNGWQNVL